MGLVACFVRIVMCQCFQLHPCIWTPNELVPCKSKSSIWRQLRKPIYFMLSKATISHTLRHSQLFPPLITQHPNMEKFIASENTFTVPTKLVYLQSFNLPNFLLTSMSPATHIHMHTRSVSEHTCTPLLCIFPYHVYIHTHIYIYVSTTWSLFTLLSWLWTHIHTYMFEQYTLPFTKHICNIDTSRHIYIYIYIYT